jgi:hypothetical protein
MKNGYLALLKEAGFHEVSIIEEAHFPAETIIAEAAAEGVGNSKTFIAEEIANSIASIKVCGVKPK